MKKNTWKHYLSFSRRERVALLLLAVIAVLFTCLPRFFSSPPSVIEIDTTAEKQLAVLTTGYDAPERKEATGNTAFTPGTAVTGQVSLFRFDPNTLDEAGWLKLGVRPRIVQIILHYREKGGRFRRPADLAKIYGLTPAEANRLMPYVFIENMHEAVTVPVVAETAEQPVAVRHYPVLDINTATAEQWEALPGIGPVLANRIVKFRYTLGGFSSVEQLKQTYGLSDSVFRNIQPYLRLTADASAADSSR
jgi:competence ComEA-like helix-hairpin-helix protein